MAVISHYSYREKYEEAAKQSGRFLGAWRKSLDDYEKLMVMLKEANDLLRSAHSIASRGGAETNWETFAKRISGVLNKQHKILNAYYGETEKQ